jgi:hypothetical protein
VSIPILVLIPILVPIPIPTPIPMIVSIPILVRNNPSLRFVTGHDFSRADTPVKSTGL